MPPPDDVRAKASSLKRYVNEIVKTAAPLIKQMRNGYRTAFERHRREIIPESDSGRESVHDAAERGAVDKAKAGSAARHPGDRVAPVEAPRDGAEPHVDTEDLAREPIENAMRAIGRHSRAGDHGAGAVPAASPSPGSAGTESATGRHFARKDDPVSLPGAPAQDGRRVETHMESDPRPATTPAPARAARAADGGPDVTTDRVTAGDAGGAMAANEGAGLAKSRAQAHDRRRDRIGRHGRPSERGADDGGEVDVLRPRGRRYRRDEGEGTDAIGPERHAMRRRRTPDARPEPESPPEKYYPHGRPPREAAGHAKSAAARTAKDRGKKKKPPTGKGSS